jgi:hypothetical protein
MPAEPSEPADQAKAKPTDSAEAEPAAPAKDGWAAQYCEYYAKNGLFSDFEYFQSAPLNRWAFALMVESALPESAFRAINDFLEIPGFPASGDAGRAVLRLYRAGVLGGASGEGFFDPFKPVTRAEAAAILRRAARPDARLRLSLPDSREALGAKAARSRLPFALEGMTVKAFDGKYIYCEPKDDAGLNGVFDLSGRQVVPWTRSLISPCSDGVFMTCINNTNFIYYGEDGARINEEPYGAGTRFRDGYAAVRKAPEPDGTITLLDRSGAERLLPATGYDIIGEYAPSEGHLVVGEHENIGFLWGMANLRTGEVTGLGYYFSLTSFYDGFSHARKDWHNFADGKDFYAYSASASAIEDANEYSNLLDTNLQEYFPRGYANILAWTGDYFAVRGPYKGPYLQYRVIGRDGGQALDEEFEDVIFYPSRDLAEFASARGGSFSRSIRKYGSWEILSLPHSFSQEPFIESNWGHLLKFVVTGTEYADGDGNISRDDYDAVSDIYGNFLTNFVPHGFGGAFTSADAPRNLYVAENDSALIFEDGFWQLLELNHM